MLQNYITSIFRYTSRNPVFTVINILGLAIGMTACMLIAQYVVHELSYDGFHSNKERLYRIQQDRYDKGELSTRWASGCAGIGPDLEANFPEVKRYTRLRPNGGILANHDVFFNEEGLYHASEHFFSMFSIPLKYGIDSVVLKDPFQIVLSESLAKKYFGSENPVGKTLKYNGETDYQVSGVFEDLPENTHMKFDALMSFVSLTKLWNDPILSWNWDGFLTYIEFNEHTDIKAFESKLPTFIQKQNGEDLKKFNAGLEFHLQPLSSIHLDSDFIGEFKANGNRQSTYFLGLIAVLILIIAWINYVNLSTAKSIERAREVGVRKVMGGFRSQLIQQFLFESAVLNAVAFIIAIAMVTMLTPWFSSFTGRELDYLLFRYNMFWLIISLLIMGGAIFSGLYPAFVLSSYKPAEVLKGRFKNSNAGIVFRKGMVVAQFVASITLIVGTFTVYRQLSYMRNQALGVSLNQTVVLHSPRVIDSTYEQKYQVFKERLLQYPEVVAVSASTTVPGRRADWNAGGIRRLSQREDEQNQYRVIMMDHDFIKSYGLSVATGRAFSSEVVNEDEHVLLNESASRLMGFTSPEQAINDQIFFWGDTFKIVGVLKDYHQESLKKAFDPMVFRYSNAPNGMYSIKFKTSKVHESLATFESVWKEIFPGNPFSHFFLDEFYDRQYQSDRRFGDIFGLFSALAIFIACLGLFGLSSLTVIQRTKEIGVRKVLGASVSSILGLVTKDYMLLLSIAMVLAIPLAGWLMSKWLTDFAYRISLSWWIFAIPCLVVVAIALVTVSIHTLRAAYTRPSKSLRYE